ncbi:hypothetical protein I4U23_016827 [Adineta vaga]|nr:hypothetical protein I4U23_016827 [Adineta vaga]
MREKANEKHILNISIRFVLINFYNIFICDSIYFPRFNFIMIAQMIGVVLLAVVMDKACEEFVVLLQNTADQYQQATKDVAL